MFSELEYLLSDRPAWTTARDGTAVRRQELVELIEWEVLEARHPYSALVDAINADPRKSFTRKSLLALIDTVISEPS